VHVHDTYFIVGHFHYVMFGGTGFAFFAALHYWYPKMFGRMYNERAAIVAFVPIFVGFNLLYFTFLVLGLQGMPGATTITCPDSTAGIFWPPSVPGSWSPVFC